MDQTAERPEYAQALSNELLSNCRVLPDRENLLALLPQGKSWCEVGVGIGDFSKEVLEKCKVSTYYAIDMFSLYDASLPQDADVRRKFRGMNIFNYYRERFNIQIESGVMEILRGDRVDMLSHLPPKGVDIFSVNFNRDYKSLMNELSVIGEKIANDGIIVISDYIMGNWLTEINYGVVQAANDFMIRGKWEMMYFVLHEGMFCDIAIRKL